MRLIAAISTAAAVVALAGRIATGPPIYSGPAAALDTSSWTPYASDRYGFVIGHPTDWSERPSEGAWALQTDAADFLTTASEGFLAPAGDVLVTAWSVPVDPGTTVDSWLEGYCVLNTTPCTGLDERTSPVTLDGHPGSLVRFADDTQAFILVDDRMYVAAVWRPDVHPSTASYGGSVNLLEGFLSTMDLLPGGPAIDTSAWPTYTSDRYGISIGHPADWAERASEGTWAMADAADWQSPTTEGFMAPGSSILVTAWSVPVDPGATAGSWLATYCAANTTPCTGLEERTTAVTVDGHPGSLVRFADDVQAFIPVDDRMYVVAAWRPEGDPSTVAYGGTTRLLKGYLSTVRLLPAGPMPSWSRYDSDRYGIGFAYPDGWSVRPAVTVRSPGDIARPTSPAMDHLIAPDGTIRVSAWFVPLDAEESADEDIGTWVAAHCEEVALGSCSDIPGRAVPLCVEARDCHPALMVPFEGGLQAFIPAQNGSTQGMTIITAWATQEEPGPSSDADRQATLETILATMGVWPESVPFGERVDPSE